MKRINILQLLTSIFVLTILSLSACKKAPPKLDNSVDDLVIDDGNPSIDFCDLLEDEGDIVLTNDPDKPIDYIVRCFAKIRDRTVSIEPGTVIVFTDGAGLNFERNAAAIIAKGTAEEPIVFRGTRPNKGHWVGLEVHSYNENNELDHVIIRDAGGGGDYYGNQAALSIADFQNYGKIKLTNSQLINNEGYALNVRVDRGYYELDYVNISNNVITNNGKPARLSIYTISMLNKSNQITGNEEDVIDFQGSIDVRHATNKDATWYNHGIPYNMVGAYHVFINSKITIEPGVRINMNGSSDFGIGLVHNEGDDEYQNNEAALIAKGTAEEPIVFSAVNKTWNGMSFYSYNLLNELSHVIIENTGPNGDDMWYYRNVFVDAKASLKINNAQFNNSNLNFCAIYGEKLSESEFAKINVDLETIEVEEGQCKINEW